MQVRWLGWAGAEIEAQGERLVIDPLADAGAVWSWLGERRAEVPLPDVVPAAPGALGGLITHLHRDHADADALIAALAPGAPVLEPVAYPGRGLEELGVLQAEQELAAAGVERRPAPAWSTVVLGPFTVTALPALDGVGDPQVSWLVEADGQRVVHLGDTMFHGWWWRIRERFGAPDVVLAPISGAVLSFPHRQPASPLPGVLDPEQAALAAQILAARQLVPIHYDAYAFPGVYVPAEEPLPRVERASDRVVPLAVGESLRVGEMPVNA